MQLLRWEQLPSTGAKGPGVRKSLMAQCALLSIEAAQKEQVKSGLASVDEEYHLNREVEGHHELRTDLPF